MAYHHDREQQHTFEAEIEPIVDRADELGKVWELVSALQKMMAGVIATEVIEEGGDAERVRTIAADVASYIISVHAQVEANPGAYTKPQ
jgi:hypothetical protein